MRYAINPDYNHLDATMQVTTKYEPLWEYPDFAIPAVYSSKEEIARRIQIYKSCGRDCSGDTMHGAFLGLDLAASDEVIRDRSRALYRQSMDIGRSLQVKGVVFHTGLIGGLRLKSYLNTWIDQAVDFWSMICSEYPELDVYMENSFEREPDVFLNLCERMREVTNFKLCFDYGHAILTPTPIQEWCHALAPFTGHMHLNDNDLRDDLHLIPGQGKIDFHEWKESMKQYQFSNETCLLEVEGMEKAEGALRFMSQL